MNYMLSYAILFGLIITAGLDTVYISAVQPRKKKRMWKMWIPLVILLHLEPEFVCYRAALIGAGLSFAADHPAMTVGWRALNAMITALVMKSFSYSSVDPMTVVSFLLYR